MKINPINYSYTGNSNKVSNPNFKAVWRCSFMDDFYQLGVQSYTNGDGKRFFNVIKKLSEFAPDSVLEMFKYTKVSDNNTYLKIKNILGSDKKQLTKVFDIKEGQYHNYRELQAKEALEYLESIVKNKDNKRTELLGYKLKKIPNNDVKFVRTTDAQDFMEKNIKQFCKNKTFGL